MLVVALLSMLIPIWLNRQIGCYNLDRNTNTFSTMDADAVKEQVKSSTGLIVSIISPNIGDVLTRDSVIELQTSIGVGMQSTSDHDGGTDDVGDRAVSKLSEHQSVPEANMGESDYEQGPMAGLQTTVAVQGTIIAVLEKQVVVLEKKVVVLEKQVVVLKKQVVVLKKHVSSKSCENKCVKSGRKICAGDHMLSSRCERLAAFGARPKDQKSVTVEFVLTNANITQ